MKNYKIFVAFDCFAQEQDNNLKVSFAFADDDLKLHFGGSPKKSYLLTPAQAANVFFADQLANSHNYYAHCMDITKKELKTLRKEFKKQGFMPFTFFQKVMLDDKHFSDAEVVLKQEPQAEPQKRKYYVVYTAHDSVKKYWNYTYDAIYTRRNNQNMSIFRTPEEAEFVAYFLAKEKQPSYDCKVEEIEY